MSADYKVGFEEFCRNTSVTFAPVLAVVQEFFALSDEMLETPASEPLISILRSACLTITNSYRSVLLLTMNGCASDALKVARSMFESSVSVGYLQKHPSLLSDFLDYRWVKRSKHQTFLAQYVPAQLRSVDSSESAKTESEYTNLPISKCNF